MRAELLVNALFRAFVEQIKILIRERGKKTVRIVKLPEFPVAFFHLQTVAENFRAVGNEGFVKAHVMDLRHRMAHFRLRLIIHDGAGTAVLQKGAHDHAAPTFVRDRVHAEQAVRLRVLPLEQ